MKDPLWKLRRLLDPTVSIDRAYSELNNPRRFSTPQATIEALLHSVKERGNRGAERAGKHGAVIAV